MPENRAGQKKGLLICFAIVLVCLLSVAVYAATVRSVPFQAGEALKNATSGGQLMDADGGEILAVYQSQPVTRQAVEYQMSLNITRDEGEAAKWDTQQEVVDRILEAMILVDEAEAQGLAATEEEIEEMLQAARDSYAIPEGKTLIDDYLAGAELTFEEYLQILREQAPRVIARQKLKDEVGRSYCEEHGLTFTKFDPPQEMLDAQSAYLAQLWETHQGDIVYYDR